MEGQRKELAEIIKKNRLAKGYTQSKLAEISKLSLRSIQRIENGEVYPRDFTIKALLNSLDLTEEILERDTADSVKEKKSAKIILSIGLGLIIPFIALAYISQSAHFPENHFEAYLYWIFVIGISCFVQWNIWVARIIKMPFSGK